ncbi:MAG: NAD(P)-binding protein, partial [Lachnospiraceae bacterium]|nr:NAD(P)-binding protein [Lachnospiraceae bacterium]
MRIEDEKVLVVGTGISGIAATELLLDKGVDVTLFDSNAKLDTGKLYEKSAKIKKAPLLLGDLTKE